MNIDFNFPGIFLIFSIPVIIYISKWFYSRSDLSKIEIIIFMILRTILLFQIVLIFFDPVMNINKTNIKKSNNVVLFDNSLSVSHRDSLESEDIKLLLRDVIDQKEFENYLFGDSIRKVNDVSNLNFTDNFSDVNKFFNETNFKYGSILKDYDNIYIVTDGNFTNYSSTTFPEFVPINFIHTKARHDEVDIYIENVTYNDIVEPLKENNYEVVVGFRGKTTVKNFELQIKEKNKIIKNIVEKVPDSGTLKRLSFSLKSNDTDLQTTEFNVLKLPDESNIYNNSRKIYQKVLNNQKKILVVYGNLSLDLKFFLDILKKNNISYELHNSNYEASSLQAKDNDMVLLYSYPNKKRNPQLDSLINKFNSKLIFVTEKSDRKKINTLVELKLNNFKPVYRKGYIENNTDNLSSYLYAYEDEFINLNGLPSVEYDAGFIPDDRYYYPIININSEKLNHAAYQSLDQLKKTTLINMRYFWRALSIFDNSNTISEPEKFFLNIIEYLSIDKISDNIKIFSNKPVFTSGEKIIFQGKVFDDNFSPLKNQVVKILVAENNAESEFVFSGDKYSTSLDISDPGLYTAKISLYKDNKEFMFVNKEFKIIENNIELSQIGANMDLMQDVSERYNGKLIPLSEAEDNLKSLIGKTKTVTEHIKINLVKNIYFFILMLLIFLIELGYRKYKDLL